MARLTSPLQKERWSYWKVSASNHSSAAEAISPHSAGQAGDCLQGPPLLSASGLGFRRGDRWLFRGLTFRLEAGELLAVVGPSGVGKTTLLSCLSGLLEPTEGKVEFFLDGGECGLTPGSVRSRLGIVFQQLALIPNANLLTNVLCGRLGRLSCWRTLFGFHPAWRREAFRLLAQ